MISLQKIAAGAAMAGALSLTAVGLGSGIASATPAMPGIPWQQDGHGHGHGHGDWDDDGGGPGPWWGPPAPWGGAPVGCISASGPFGYVQGSACI